LATLNLQVAASADDALETSGGSCDPTQTVQWVGGTGWVGLRWVAAIPQGSTINSATLTVYCHGASDDDAHFNIWGEDVDDAPQFTTGNSNISSRTLTAAEVDWDEAATGTGWKSPSGAVTAIVQEVVGRPGWSSGNGLVIILEGQTDCLYSPRAWDYSDNTYGAKLDIDYTPATGAAALPVLSDGAVNPLVFGGVTVR